MIIKGHLIRGEIFGGFVNNKSEANDDIGEVVFNFVPIAILGAVV